MYNNIEKAIFELEQDRKILPSKHGKCCPKHYNDDMFMIQQLAPAGVNNMMNEMEMGMCNMPDPCMYETMVAPMMMQPQVKPCMLELYKAYPYLKP